jgi:hypothetical protein
MRAFAMWSLRGSLRGKKAPISPPPMSRSPLATANSKKTNYAPAAIVELKLKIAELRETRGEWPAGTTGTIVEAFDDGALFEIADDEGCTLAMLPVSYEDLLIGSGAGNPGVAHPVC